MKKQFVLLFFFLFFFHLIFSQKKITIGINTGGNISFIKDSFENNIGTGFLIGLNAEYAITNNISLKSNINYLTKSFSAQVEYTDEFGNSQIVRNAKFNYKFISIPLLIKYSFAKSNRMFIHAGINFDYLFQNKYISTVSNNKEIDTPQLDLDFSLGLGTKIPIKNNALNIELRFNPYLTNLFTKNKLVETVKTSTLALINF